VSRYRWTRLRTLRSRSAYGIVGAEEGKELVRQARSSKPGGLRLGWLQHQVQEGPVRRVRHLKAHY